MSIGHAGHKHVLLVPHVTDDDHGIYTCHANNHIGEAKGNIKVIGQWNSIPSPIVYFEAVDITCNASFTWYLGISFFPGSIDTGPNENLFLVEDTQTSERNQGRTPHPSCNICKAYYMPDYMLFRGDVGHCRLHCRHVQRRSQVTRQLRRPRPLAVLRVLRAILNKIHF
jgi:hypothetical protein